jgi:hypothetical protein
LKNDLYYVLSLRPSPTGGEGEKEGALPQGAQEGMVEWGRAMTSTRESNGLASSLLTD